MRKSWRHIRRLHGIDAVIRRGEPEEARMVRLRVWLERFMEARRAARDARLFARIVDERAARRSASGAVG